MNHLFEAGHL